VSFSGARSTLFKIALGALFVFATVRFLDGTASETLVWTSPTPSPSLALSAAPTVTRTQTPQTARPTTAAFSITVSDADLTKSAAAGFPQTVSGVTVTDPQVSIESDRVRLVARAKVLFGTTEFVMTGTPLVSDGKLAIRVDTATLAGISLPSDTRASISQTVQATIANYVPTSVKVTSVSLAPGTLTVQGTQR
jgi:hypothetical protein